MLATYVVLDGFDFGAGALHLFVAKNDPERRQVLAAIGPFWDANEVWLLATGGVLFLAFPPVLASGLSGFYFAIFLVLWMLILRGIAIEFRSHVDHPLWRSAWDGVFGVASAVLPVLFGAALGNLVRGLPIDADGWFSLALFTDFTVASAGGDSRLVHRERGRLRARGAGRARGDVPGLEDGRARARSEPSRRTSALRHGRRAVARRSRRRRPSSTRPC